MSDTRPDYNDDLPWLEPVDSEEEPRPVSGRKMLFALLIVLIAAAIVSGTFFWLGRRQAAETIGAPELIRAEPGPYKVKPTDPGGLDVAGESETAFQTSAGQDTDAQLNVSALPQQPKAEPKSEPKAVAEAPKTEAEPAAKPTGAQGSVVQLGAYKNAAQAERAWTILSSRFQSLAGTSKMVVPFAGGYRLRAAAPSPAEARQVCQAIRSGGENCFVAN
jgi:hypothetical protein